MFWVLTIHNFPAYNCIMTTQWNLYIICFPYTEPHNSIEHLLRTTYAMSISYHSFVLFKESISHAFIVNA
jgi:hypothetical protein